MYRRRRVEQLREEVASALEELDLPLDTRAHDPWLNPHALADALKGDDDVLVRVGLGTSPAEDGFAAPPTQPTFVRFDAAGEAHACTLGESGQKVLIARIRLHSDEEECCDSPKCSATRDIHELRLEMVDGEPWTMGEATETVGLAQVGAALAARLSVDFDGPETDETFDATPASPLSARSLARWTLRREGDIFVLRDHASRGPREAAVREWIGTGVFAAGGVAGWVAAYTAYRAADNETFAIYLAVAVVLTLAAYATSYIAMHSARYRAKSEALFYASRDRVVVAPWHSRSGAVDLKPEGRYGAALRIGELEGIDVVPLGEGFALRASSTHGLYDIGTLETEEQAKAWRAALTRLLERVSHHAALALMAAVLLACGPTAEPSPPPLAHPTTAAPSVPSAASPSAPSGSAPRVAEQPTVRELAMVDDDIGEAMRLAKEDGRLVFVEVWAPWCHTCLSMKNFVLPEPSVVALQDRVVFAAIDSDRKVNEGFMDRYTVMVWPTLFVLDPKDGAVIDLWQGAASAKELRDFIVGAADTRTAKLDPNGPVAAMIKAKQAHAKSGWKAAGAHYQAALDRGGSAWARRSEALYGLLFSAYRGGDFARCAKLGIEHVAEIRGAAVPADFSWVMLSCAKRSKNKGLLAQARKMALARLKSHTDAPPAAASVDDKSDALAMYAAELLATGDKKHATLVRNKQLALLEAAATAAPGPKEAATFDYARMGAYLAVGQGDKAVAMLQARVQQLPDSYEAPARLAQALMTLGRNEDARAPLQRAVDKSYGPRKLGYLSRQARLRKILKDPAGEKSALEALVTAYDALGTAQRKHPPTKKLADSAKKRLGEL